MRSSRTGGAERTDDRTDGLKNRVCRRNRGFSIIPGSAAAHSLRQPPADAGHLSRCYADLCATFPMLCSRGRWRRGSQYTNGCSCGIAEGIVGGQTGGQTVVIGAPFESVSIDANASRDSHLTARPAAPAAWASDVAMRQRPPDAQPAPQPLRCLESATFSARIRMDRTRPLRMEKTSANHGRPKTNGSTAISPKTTSSSGGP
jgi:hypothetical protein